MFLVIVVIFNLIFLCNFLYLVLIMFVGLIDVNVFVLLFWFMYSYRLFDFKCDY